MSTKRLALGTVQFGLAYGVGNKVGQVQPAEVEQILSVAKDNGINSIDTAIAYGTSEEVLGKAGVNGYRVVTKLLSLSTAQSNVAFWVWDQLEASLARLGQEKLYGLLLHRPQDLLGSKGAQLIQVLEDLKNCGVVQKIGVSIYGPNELDEICNRIQIDLVQAPLNVIDRRMEASGWLQRLKADGVEVHARSAFLQGLLLMERTKIPEKFSRWSKLWDQWHEKLKISGISSLAASLAYPLSLEQVDKVIVGVDSAKQLQDIITVASAVDHDLDTSFMMCTDSNLINPSCWNHL
jgi:aryl-alcohol dehydrogenase-like predicted oxidoreductase